MRRAYGLEIFSSLPELCDPARAALLIYDMQVGIVPQIQSGARVLQGCQRLLQASRGAGLRVIYTKHISVPNEAAGAVQLRRAMIWQRTDDATETKPAFLRTAQAAEIVPELAPMPSEVVIEKITMSAFEGTYLNILLRDLRLQSLIIAGIALEVGIEPTVRQALDLNYVPIVVGDLCGSRTEELHERSIATMQETGEVIVTSLKEILPLLGETL